MFYIQSFLSLLEVVMALIPSLLSVAYITVAERKTMASMQRRLGPDTVGYYGLLQAFADALKLLLKEYVFPTQANAVLFFLGPVVTLMFSLLGFYVIPYAPGITISDFNLGILYMLAMSSLSTYGILLAGWSANSKYAFLGSLRSTAQLISYELILGSAILLVILFSGSLSLTTNIEAQKAIWYALPICPVFIIFFIGSVAETNRAPFDLVEAESELVSGFMTEHAGVIFVFFFLAEYASILLICILTSTLFLGGYLFDTMPVFNVLQYLCYPLLSIIEYLRLGYLNLDFIPNWFGHTMNNFYYDIVSLLKLEPFMDNPEYFTNDFFNMHFSSNPLIEGIKCSVVFAVKSCIMIFVFIWTRASYPRIRYDQLMSYCWTVLLPVIIALIVIIPCVLYNFSILPSNICLFFIFANLREPNKLTKTYKAWLCDLVSLCLVNPPKPHTFVSLPLQSKVDFHLSRDFRSSMDSMTVAMEGFKGTRYIYIILPLQELPHLKEPWILDRENWVLDKKNIYAVRDAIVAQENENVRFFNTLTKKALEIRDSKKSLIDRQDGAHDVHLYVSWWFRQCKGSVLPQDASDDCITISKNIVEKGNDPSYNKDNHQDLVKVLDEAKKWRIKNSDELRDILDEITNARF